MDDNKKLNLLATESLCLILAFVLVADGIGATLSRLFASGFLLINLVNLATYGVIIYYGAWGYKIPHGNTLKYAMLALSVSMAIRTVALASTGVPVQIMTAASLAACSILIAYMSGRLNRIRQGNIICLIVVCIQVLQSIIRVICGAQDFLRLSTAITSLNALIQCIAIAAVYFARYRLHTKAGLQDKTE